MDTRANRIMMQPHSLDLPAQDISRSEREIRWWILAQPPGQPMPTFYAFASPCVTPSGGNSGNP